MKTQFQAKFLQHLAKNKNKGFTLIELLVVIIIVGVLAAIALPSFLNQIGKARGGEAKANLGAVNRSQQSYRLENRIFASDVADMDAKYTEKFYDIEMENDGITGAAAGTANTLTAEASTTEVAAAVASPTDDNRDLKVYASGVAQAVNDTFAQVICESDEVAANGGTASVVVSGAAGADASAECANTTDMTEVE